MHKFNLTSLFYTLRATETRSQAPRSATCGLMDSVATPTKKASDAGFCCSCGAPRWKKHLRGVCTNDSYKSDSRTFRLTYNSSCKHLLSLVAFAIFSFYVFVQFVHLFKLRAPLMEEFSQKTAVGNIHKKPTCRKSNVRISSLCLLWLQMMKRGCSDAFVCLLNGCFSSSEPHVDPQPKATFQPDKLLAIENYSIHKFSI